MSVFRHRLRSPERWIEDCGWLGRRGACPPGHEERERADSHRADPSPGVHARRPIRAAAGSSRTQPQSSIHRRSDTPGTANARGLAARLLLTLSSALALPALAHATEPEVEIATTADAAVGTEVDAEADAAPLDTVSPTPAPTSRKGFIDLNAYYDTREFSVLTLNLFAQLPARFQYFSLTNYSNAVEADDPEDLDTYYTEQNLRWNPWVGLPLDLAAQWVHKSGGDNDLVRLGLRWRLMSTPGLRDAMKKIGLVYFVSFYAAQFDQLSSRGTRMQIEHVYRIPIFPEATRNRIYLGGFLDHSLWFSPPAGGSRSSIVTEHQLGVRLFDHVYAVVEYRFNEFFSRKQHGVGFGLEYVIPFERLD